MSTTSEINVAIGPPRAVNTDFVKLRPPSSILIVALLSITLVPLLSTPVLPFIDFYNHIARYFVLSHISQDLLLQKYYATNWSLLPNIGLDIISVPLLSLIPPRLYSHIIATLIIITQYCGVLYFHRALAGRVSVLVCILLIPLSYSYILFWGFGNFVFGLGLAFAAAGYWVKHCATPWQALPLAAVFAVLIFLTHGFAFALYGVLIGSLELGYVIGARNLDVRDLARRFAPIAAQAVVPAVLFTLSATSGSAGGVSNADRSIVHLVHAGSLLQRLVAIAVYRLETIVRVAEGPSVGADVVWMLALSGVLAFLFYTKRLTLVRAMWPALALGLLLVLIVPPTMFGVGYISDRIPLYVALLFVAGLSPAVPVDGRQIAGLTAVSALASIRLVSLALSWQSYARDYGDYKTVAAAIPPGSIVTDMMVGGVAHSSRAARCGMYGPLLVVGFHQAVPLFAHETQQPLRQIGMLAAGVAAIQTPAATWIGVNPDGYDRYLENLLTAGYFKYVLVCNANLLPRQLPSFAKVVIRTPRFELLKLP